MAYAAIVRYHQKVGPMSTVENGKLWSFRPRWELLAIAGAHREAKRLGWHCLWVDRGIGLNRNVRQMYANVKVVRLTALPLFGISADDVHAYYTAMLDVEDPHAQCGCALGQKRAPH